MAYVARRLWLPALGYALIHDDGPAKADYAIVLGGDIWGCRILRGAELVRQGYVPAVLVSGPPGFYGINEADLAIQFAAGKGYPKEWFIPVRHQGLSTRAEAEVFFNELQRRGAHSFLVVTSNHHSARARRTFLSVARQHPGAPGFRTVSAPDRFFRPDDWWQIREAEKIVFMEWTKTFASAVGM
jgi:uncharacterized SAM-binding protein YcdF (DUF218 family)